MLLIFDCLLLFIDKDCVSWYRFRKFYFMTFSSILRILLKPQLNFMLFNFNFSFSSVGLNSVCIELFVNMGYFINVFFVYKLNRRHGFLKHRLCKHGFCSVLVGKEQTYNWLLVYFNLCFGLLPPVLKKINNSSKLFYTLGLLRNSIIDENNFL